jgi:predicted DNA-binding transcriptional regulator YafY
VDDIRRAYGVEIEESIQGRRKYYRLKKNISNTPVLPLTSTELTTLQMCKAFAEHLLGPDLLKDATQALEKSRAFVSGNQRFSSSHFAAFGYGYIDYTPHQETLRKLIQAMKEQKICEIIYRSALSRENKTYCIKPLKIFSHNNTLYLATGLARFHKKPYQKQILSPLLAVHRIKATKITDRFFELHNNNDFRKQFDRSFGVIKNRQFKVVVEFSGYAACYISERIWSADQKITIQKNGTVRLTLTASSIVEISSWIKSFGKEAKLIKPKHLLE